jgi:hypothetical protein
MQIALRACCCDGGLNRLSPALRLAIRRAGIALGVGVSVVAVEFEIGCWAVAYCSATAAWSA